MEEPPRNDQSSTTADVQQEVHVSVANDVDSHANQEVTWTGQMVELVVLAVRVSTVRPARSLHKNAMVAEVEARVHSALAPDDGECSLEAYEDLDQGQNWEEDEHAMVQTKVEVQVEA